MVIKYSFDSKLKEIGSPDHILYIPINTNHTVNDSTNKILGIGAHPDDIELGCGMTIEKHVQNNDEVYFLIATNGEAGKTEGRQRVLEGYLAAQEMKINGIYLLQLPDTKLPQNKDLVQRIEMVLEKIGEVKRIYTHSLHDRHQDHIATSEATSIACRFTNQILMYATPSQTCKFEPHHFIPHNREFIEMKKKILLNYQSQIDTGIVDLETIYGEALFWGKRMNTHNTSDDKFAEPFEINHYIEHLG